MQELHKQLFLYQRLECDMQSLETYYSCRGSHLKCSKIWRGWACSDIVVPLRMSCWVKSRLMGHIASASIEEWNGKEGEVCEGWARRRVMSNCSTVSWFRWPAGWDTGMWTPYIPHVASSMGFSLLNVGIPWWLSLWYHWDQFPMTLKVQLM